MVFKHFNYPNTEVKGLTTAASIWGVAINGCCFGAGQILVAFSGLMTVLIILILGHPLERGGAKVLGLNRSSELDNYDE